MSVFPNAQNFTINNGSFTNVTGGLNVYRKWDDQDYPGLKILHQNAVWSASYNSEQRFPPPNCHLGTRTQVLEILKNWITDTTNRTSVYWLYGAAGVGKSAVAQTISEEFSASHLAASFFFARTDSSRNNLLSFFITISHQLATSSQLGPLLKYPIDVTVRDNPGIVHAVLEEQFQELIVMPCHWLTVTCRLTPEKLENLPRLIVIDGLDECIDIASQERLLSLIRKATSAKATSATQFPFKFLICSRPEPRIRNAFSHQDFYSILDCTDIGESFESGKDIAKYLRHEFGRIQQEHGQSMAHVAKDWPGNGIIQQLMLKACGQFIYATTVLKYIGDPDGLPTERLEIILKITVPDDFDSPYPDLDQLYMQILSVCPQRELLLEVMAHILIPTGIFFDTRYERRSPAIIEGIFSLPKGKVRALLSRLHSVLLIPENDKKNIAVRHASFVDFLTDRKRSGRYFVNTQKEAQHERVLFYLLKILSKSMINSWKHHFECAQSQFDQYACAFWGSHFQKIRNDSFSSRILTELNQLDVCGLLNMALQGKNVSLKVYSDTLKSCLGDFERVVQWAKALRQGSDPLPILDTLIGRYTLFESGIRMRIPHRQVRGNLIVPVSTFRNIVLRCLPEMGEEAADSLRLEMILLSLRNQMKEVFELTEVHNILHSPWPTCPPILPLNPPQFDFDLWNNPVAGSTLMIIDFAECHRELGLQCLRILSSKSVSGTNYHFQDVVTYARNYWINHILKTPPSKKMLQVALDNMSLLPLNEDVRTEVVVWAKGAEKSRDKATKLVKQIQQAFLNGDDTPTYHNKFVDEKSRDQVSIQQAVEHIQELGNSVGFKSQRKIKPSSSWLNRLDCFGQRLEG